MNSTIAGIEVGTRAVYNNNNNNNNNKRNKTLVCESHVRKSKEVDYHIQYCTNEIKCLQTFHLKNL